MTPKTDRPFRVRSQHARLKAVLALRGRRFEDFYRALPVTPRHAYCVLIGERQGSADLLAAMRRALGEPGWQFVTGQTSVLCDDGSDHAAP